MFSIYVLSNTLHDIHYYIEAYSPIIIGFIAAIIAIIANVISKRALEQERDQFEKQLIEQREQFNKQFELQKLQFKYDNFFKYKQDILLDFRKIYCEFQLNILDFIHMFLPSGIAPINQSPSEPPIITDIEIDNQKVIPLYEKKSYNINPNKLLSNFLISSKNLYNFLTENDIFLQDNKELYDDLLSVSRSFKDLFENLPKTINIEEFFYKDNGYYYFKTESANFKEFFYTFMWGRLMVFRNDTNTSLFYALSDSVFKVKNLSYTPENIKLWVQNNIILFQTAAIFSTYFNIWQKAINDFFNVSIKETGKL